MNFFDNVMVNRILWQTVTHMYEINELMNEHKAMYTTHPNNYRQASKLTLQITPLLSLISPYSIFSSARLVSFGFMFFLEWWNCYCMFLNILSTSSAAASVAKACHLTGVLHALLGSVAPGTARSGIVT